MIGWLLVGCTTNSCPESGHEFVPAEDPAQVYVNADGVVTCDGKTMDYGESSAYYSVYCDCTWCSPLYRGQTYCVTSEDLHNWMNAECPGCSYYYSPYGGGPHVIHVECDDCLQGY